MKKRLIKIIIAAIIYLVAIIIPFNNVWITNALYVVSYIIVGLDILKKAIRNITRGRVFDENFLMAVATLGAFGVGEFPEAVAVMLFYQVGELFQSYAVAKSRKSIASLMDLRPDYANLKKGDEIEEVDPDDVEVGDIIVVKPGEKVPLDGIVIEGESLLDTSALTGESVPRTVREQDEILSGCINQSGVLTIEVTKEFDESTVSKILDLVENAASKKAKSENFITKFAKYYTPVVVIIAVILAIVPPVLEFGDFSTWIYRALSFLVVSCPCALVISIPLGFFGGIGGASKLGVLVKGSNYLEVLSKVDTVVMDKTGTLTEGVFEVQTIHAEDGVDEAKLLEYAAYVESFSSHPIALSIKNSYAKELDNSRVKDYTEIAGKGVSAVVDAKVITASNNKLLIEQGIEYTECDEIGTILYITIDNVYAGYIVIADKIKDDSKYTISELKKRGIKQTVMLTGDKDNVGQAVASEIGIDKAYTELLPDQKVEKVEELLKNKSENSKLAYVGDGINDAPVLTLSDVGIAMGGLGSDAAIEAADVVIMTDEPSKILKAIKISKKTMKIVMENIYFAIGVKVLVLILSALGLSSMWQAVFADVGVTVIAILNSFRMLNVKRI